MIIIQMDATRASTATSMTLMATRTAAVSLNSTSSHLFLAFTTPTFWKAEANRRHVEDRNYSRDRSRSPVGDRDGDARVRDEPMNGRGDRYVLRNITNSGRTADVHIATLPRPAAATTMSLSTLDPTSLSRAFTRASTRSR